MGFMGIGLDYVCMICCMNDTRWLYKSVDFGYCTSPSLSRAVDHVNHPAEGAGMPDPPNPSLSPRSTKPS